MSENTAKEAYTTQNIQLENFPDYRATVSYYENIPHRVEMLGAVDEDGLFENISAVYTQIADAPFTIRFSSKFAEIVVLNYQYEQFKGFVNIGTDPLKKFKKDYDLPAAVMDCAKYLNDLLMFHQIDPPSCTYVNGSGEK